jgi:Domain of unknown function (DUF4365)
MGDLGVNFRKEYFSIAYIEALAYTAGYAVEHVKVDVYGVDLEIRDGAFRIDVQMKCAAQDASPGAPTIPFDLDVKTYRKLTDPYRNVPAYLFIVEVPVDVGQWVACFAGGISLLKCGYYKPMSDLGRTSNRRTQRIWLTRDNRLTVESLDRLMKESKG